MVSLINLVENLSIQPIPIVDPCIQSPPLVNCVVSILCGNTQGSGIILTPNIVLTCGHVVEQSDRGNGHHTVK